MPIYEYRCSRCEHEIAAERLLSTFAVRVSGGARVTSSGKSCGGCRRSSCATC